MCAECKGTGWILYKDENGIDMARRCSCVNVVGSNDNKGDDKNRGE